MPAKKTTAKKSAARKAPPKRDPDAGKGAHVLELLYYYIAAIVGLGMLIGGAIAVVLGLRTVVLPGDFETARDGVQGILHGLAFALPGLALLWWHLREAKRRESWKGADVFWGKVVYFHLGALIALGFTTIAVSGILHGIVEVVMACDETTRNGVQGCYGGNEHAWRIVLNFALVGLVAAPIYWWHLREGRRATQPGLEA